MGIEWKLPQITVDNGGTWCLSKDKQLKIVSLILQSGVAGSQRAHGLHYSCPVDVEFWCGWDDLCPLERATNPPASLPHHYLCPYVPYLHQVPTWLDSLGCPWSHGYLGSVKIRSQLLIMYLFLQIENKHWLNFSLVKMIIPISNRKHFWYQSIQVCTLTCKDFLSCLHIMMPFTVRPHILKDT